MQLLHDPGCGFESPAPPVQKYFSISDFSGGRIFYDRVHNGVDNLIVNDQFEFHLWEEVHFIFPAAHFRDRHAVDAKADEGDFYQFEPVAAERERGELEYMSEYNARILAYTALADPIEMQREAVSMIAELLAGRSDEELRARHEPGKWSVLEILMHLADDELVSTWRYRQMIERSGCELSAFDQDLWARLVAYGSWRADEGLALFRLLREANLRMFSQLTAEQWECWGLHAERGRITVRELARHMAGHDRNHIDQIRGLVRRSPR